LLSNKPEILGFPQGGGGMLRRLGFIIIVLGAGLPALAAKTPGMISGYVRNMTGVPQMGAMVEVLDSATSTFTVFTDEKGFYNAVGLLPGVYRIKVSAPSFLPVLRERVGLTAGANLLINITLSTLFEAIQLAPAHGSAEGDEWKWVLRSGANRPILRMVDDDTAVLTTETRSNSRLKGSLSFVAGGASGGFGSDSDLGTGFSVERSIFSSDTIGLQGNVGYGNSSPASIIRASFSHRDDDGTGPEIAFTMRNLPAPDTVPGAGMQALSLQSSDELRLGDVLELKFGSELQTIQFLGRVTAFRPFGTADFHLSKDTVVEYRYATSVPDGLANGDLDTLSPDLGQSNPRVSMMNYSSTVENDHHHELSVSHRAGKNNLQAAAYYDRVSDPALTGVGEFSSDGGIVLPDIYSGTFTYRGKGYSTEGFRLVAERELLPGLTATFDYSFGGALELARPEASLQDVQQSARSAEHSSVTGKLKGVIPKSHTQWTASYRWADGSILSPVDMFNASAGRADPFLDILIRQPIPGMGFFPGHVEAIVDVRNLLAQGYVPVVGQDGHPVYLVQSAKAVRGGVAFTF
jgi:hypothetical protein